MFTPSSLPIAGYRDLPVPNTFVRQPGETDHLALILPGYAYPCEMPALYYPAALLLSLGADVLHVRYAYNENPDFRALPEPEQDAWLFADVAAATAAALAQRPYQRVTLVGKSLGTLAMGHLLATDSRLAGAYCVWLTPLLSDATLVAQMRQHCRRAFFVIGTADSEYDAATLAELRQATGGDALVVEGAHHGLEISDDLERSILVMRDLVAALRIFLHAE